MSFTTLPKTGRRHSSVSRLTPEGATQFHERRRDTRLPIAIPVELAGGTGITRDVSLSGVFFETDRYLVLGEQIRLTLLLGRLSPDYPVRLQCDGRVVRVERREMQVRLGVAVAIESYRFMTREQSRGFA